jgi:hypothetical protein
MFQAKINSATPISGGAIVIVSVSHGRDQVISPEQFRAEMQNVAGHKMTALAGSFQVIESGPFRKLVRGAMVPTREVIPFNRDNMRGFHSLSASIYQDESENMWQLKQDSSGDYLVKANNIDDIADIEQLMASLSSSPIPGSDNAYFSAVASVQEEVKSAKGGDFITYFNKGALCGGIVVASLSEENDDESLVVLHGKEEAVDVIDHSQVTSIQDNIESVSCAGLTLNVPEHLASQSASASETIEKLVSYYQKVYGHNATFFSKLEQQIRGHAWA